MLEKLLCLFGFHEWVYLYPKTGAFLHTFIPVDTRDFVRNWHKRKCDYCGKREYGVKRNSSKLTTPPPK